MSETAAKLSGPAEPRLTVLIVNWNARDMLRDCLNSLATCPASGGMKTIVVDNDSRDGSLAMVRSEFPEVVAMNSGGNLGFSRANNLGLRHADTPLVLFLNPDTLVRPETLNRMIAVFSQHPEVGAVGARMIHRDGRTQNLNVQWFPTPLTEFIGMLLVSDEIPARIRRLLPHHDAHRTGYVRNLCGGCLMVRKTVLDSVGSFDERFFMYGEDVDLCERIVRGGWRILYLAEAEIVHLVGGATGRNVSGVRFSTLMKCDSRWKLIRKRQGLVGAVLYRLSAFAGACIRLAALAVFVALPRPLRPCQSLDRRMSVLKYRLIVGWCLGLSRPAIRS
jgi:GT2 family glycosyltransferase